MSHLIAFVSVKQSYEDDMTLAELSLNARGNWPLSIAKARRCDILVAVLSGTPIGAWKVIDAYATDETYTVGTAERPRVAFVLGEALPVAPEYGTEFEGPRKMRRGIMTEEWTSSEMPAEDEMPPAAPTQ